VKPGKTDPNPRQTLAGHSETTQGRALTSEDVAAFYPGALHRNPGSERSRAESIRAHGNAHCALISKRSLDLDSFRVEDGLLVHWNLRVAGQGARAVFCLFGSSTNSDTTSTTLRGGM
jgi:hypothetical protein